MIKEPLISVIIRSFRYRAVKKYIKGNVLDLGCGTGTLAKLIPAGQNYIGIDRNP